MHLSRPGLFHPTGREQVQGCLLQHLPEAATPDAAERSRRHPRPRRGGRSDDLPG